MPPSGAAGWGAALFWEVVVERIGFRMRLMAGSEAEYVGRHAAVWPDLLADLSAAGASNYSIFLDGEDLFGYLEVADFAAFLGHMADSGANARWQPEMAALIDPLTDPGTGFHHRMREVFHLD
jgi:L-rhamnose mutarotase